VVNIQAGSDANSSAKRCGQANFAVEVVRAQVQSW
jgi:hypothetical protein